MIDALTYEMIKRIVANVGAVPDESFGRRGLTDSRLLLQKTISIRYEDGTHLEHDIYAGQLKMGESTDHLKGLLINLSSDDVYEFLFLFRYNTMPIHAIKVVYGNPDESFIRIVHRDDEDNEKWILPSVYMKARLLADFERFVSYGLLWNECKEVSDLYDTAVVLAENR